MASRLATAYMAIRADKQLFRKDLDAIKKMAKRMVREIKFPATIHISKVAIARELSEVQKLISTHLKSVPFEIGAKVNTNGLRKAVRKASDVASSATRRTGGKKASYDPAEEAKRITEAMRTPFEDFQAKVARLRDLVRSKNLKPETFARAAAKEWDDYQRKLKKLTATTDRAERAKDREAKRIKDAQRSPQQKFQDEVKRLESRMIEGRINPDEFAQAKAAARRVYEKEEKLRNAPSAEEKARRREAERITEATRTPLERFQRRLQRLESMRGSLSPETYDRAVSKARAKWTREEVAARPNQDRPAIARSTKYYDRALQGMSRNIATPRLNLGPIRSDLSKLHTMFKVSFARIAEIAAGIGTVELIRHLASGVAEFGKAMITTNANVEQFKTSLRIMMGDGKAANKMFADLRKFAIETAFTLPDAMKAAQRFMRAGFVDSDILPLLQDIGDAAAVSPDGMAFAVERISYALSQMHNAAKVNAQDMRQLTEAGLPAWKFLAESRGVSVQEATEMASRGEISGQEGVKAIREGIRRNYGGAQQERAKDFWGQMDILLENIGLGMEKIGQGPFENIKIAIGDMIDWTGSEEGQAVIAQLASTMRELADGALAAFQAFQSFFGGVTALAESIGAFVSAVLSPFSDSLGSLSWWFKGIIDLVHVFGLGMELAGLSVKSFFDVLSGGKVDSKGFEDWKKRAMGEMPSERMDRLAREREAKKERDANRKKQPVTPRPPKNVVGGELAKWQQQQKAMFGVAVTGQEQSEQASAREEFTKNLLKTYDSLKDAEPGDRVAKLREELERMAAVGIDPRQYAEMSRAINMIDAQTKFNNAAQASQDFRDKLRDMRIEMGTATEGQKMLADAIAKGVPPEALVRLRQLAAEFDAVKRVSEMVGEFKSLQEEMRKLGREASETIRAQQIRADMRAAGYGENQIDATIRQDKALRSQAEAWRTFGDAMKTTLTPMQQFDKAVRLLDTLLRGHKITIEDYRKAVGNLRAELSKSAKSEARTPAGELLEKINEYNKMVGKDGLTKEERDSLVRRAKGGTLGWTVKDAEEEYLYERQKAMEAHKKNPELFTSRDYDRAVDIARRERNQRMMEAAPREAIEAQAEEQLKKLNSLKERGRISDKDYARRSQEILQMKDIALEQAGGRGRAGGYMGLAESAQNIQSAILGAKDPVQQRMLEFARKSAEANQKTAEGVTKMNEKIGGGGAPKAG